MQKYQQLQQQIQQIQEFIEQVEESVEEVETTVKAAKNLENQEIGSEILVPIGSGAFVVGELKENKKIVTNIGGEAFEKKETENAASLLKERKEELEETQEELQQTVTQLQGQMQEIQQELQQNQEQQK